MKFTIIFTLLFFSLLVIILFTPQRNAEVYADEDTKAKINEFTDKRIDRCNDLDNPFDPRHKKECVDILLHTSHTYCQSRVYHDKLDFCKNGKLEGYLKEHGKL